MDNLHDIITLELRAEGQIWEIENGKPRSELLYPPEPGRQFYRPGDILFWNYNTPRELQRQYPRELGMPGETTATDCLVTLAFFYTGVIDEVYKIKTGLRLEFVSRSEVILRNVLLFEDGTVKPVGDKQERSLRQLAYDFNLFGRYFPKDREFEKVITNYTWFLVKNVLPSGIYGANTSRIVGKTLARNVTLRFIRSRLSKMLSENLLKFFLAIVKALVLEMIKEYNDQEKYNLADAPVNAIDHRKVVEATIQKTLSESFTIFLLPEWMKPVLEGLAGGDWQARLSRVAAEEAGNLFFKDQAGFFARFFATLISHSKDKDYKEAETAIEKMIQETPSHILETHLKHLAEIILMEAEK